jgi:HlyD family secretion protein
MSVTAQVETRYRTNVLAVPIAAVTTRPPKQPSKPDTNVVQLAASTNAPVTAIESSSSGPDLPSGERANKPIEVVFVVEGDLVRQQPVKLGISDNSHFEIEEGLKEDQEIVTGGFLAISRQLEDGKKIVRGGPGGPAKPPTP